VEAPQPAQPAAPGAQTTPVGKLDRVGVAHHDVLDIAAAVDQDADLTSDLAACFRQLSRQLLRQQLVGGDAAPEKALQLTNLACLEAVRITEYLGQSTLSRAKRR
jgi:hypothetical protein